MVHSNKLVISVFFPPEIGDEKYSQSKHKAKLNKNLTPIAHGMFSKSKCSRMLNTEVGSSTLP